MYILLTMTKILQFYSVLLYFNNDSTLKIVPCHKLHTNIAVCKIDLVFPLRNKKCKWQFASFSYMRLKEQGAEIATTEAKVILWLFSLQCVLLKC